MRMLVMELKKEKRTGIKTVLLAAGIGGAAYAVANFLVRKDALLRLPMAPMDILLTQLYGVILMMNMFGIIVAATMIYQMECKGNAVRKMCLLPVSVSAIYKCKFSVLTSVLFVAVVVQNLTLAQLGMIYLPAGAFEGILVLRFAGYSFLTAMPVLSFMLFISSCSENMWVGIGVGVAGFLSAMALAVTEAGIFLLHPFVVMLQPALAMSAQPDNDIISIAVLQTVFWFGTGVWKAKYLCCE